MLLNSLNKHIMFEIMEIASLPRNAAKNRLNFGLVKHPQSAWQTLLKMISLDFPMLWVLSDISK